MFSKGFLGYTWDFGGSRHNTRLLLLLLQALESKHYYYSSAFRLPSSVFPVHTHMLDIFTLFVYP